jgi:exopolysaccharide production protein ExoQ
MNKAIRSAGRSRSSTFGSYSSVSTHTQLEEPPGRPANRLERLWLGYILFLGTGALIGWRIQPFADAAVEGTDGDLLVKGIWVLAGIGVCWIVLRHWRSTMKLIKGNKLFACFVGYACFSFLWSAFGGGSFRQCLGLFASALAGFALAATCTRRQVLHLLSHVLGFGVVMSAVAGVAMRSRAVDAAGIWRGVYLQKNTLGRMAVLFILVLVVRWLCGDSRRRLIPQLALAFMMLLKSQSSTSMLAGFVALGAALLFAGWRRRATRDLTLYLIFASCVGLASLAVIYGMTPREGILALSGKDSTFSGRTQIWAAVIPFVHQKLFFGWGYGGFWRGAVYPSSDVWAQLASRPLPSHSHNAYLELFLSFGTVGACLFLTGLGLTLFRTFRRSKQPVDLLCVGFLVFMLVDGLGENAFVGHQTLNWILLTYSTGVASTKSYSTVTNPSSTYAVPFMSVERPSIKQLVMPGGTSAT